MANLCLNVLYDNYPNIEAAQSSLYPYLRRTPNDSIIVTTGTRKEQGHQFALYLKNDFPDMEVILRLMPDDHIHERMTPRQWFDSFAPFSDGGRLTLYCNNEPGAGDLERQDAWYAGTEQNPGVLRLAGQAGIKVAVFNIQTHNPFDPARMKATLQLCAQYQHPYCMHYYYGKDFPVDPLHKVVVSYCRSVGIGRFPIYITEVGFCNVGYDSEGNPYLIPDQGYHGRLDSETYGLELTNLAFHYFELKWFIYGWGDPPPWGEFDISRDTVVQNATVIHNEKGNPLPVIVFPPTSGGVRGTITKIPSEYVNVRAQPDASGADLGNLVKGEHGTFFPDAIHNGWMYFEPDSNPKGWVSLQNGAVAFTADAIPVPPTDGYSMTEEQLSALKKLSGEIQNRTDAINDILKEVESSGNGGGF